VNDGTKFALALVILWLAGVALFVAFHPGGISVNGQPAQNPADVIRYFITLAGKGKTTPDTSDGSSDVQAV
jgi:hypothetical protein